LDQSSMDDHTSRCIRFAVPLWAAVRPWQMI